MTAQLSLDAGTNLDNQVQDILMGRLGPWPLGDKERQVLHMLRYRRGAAQARPLAELATELKMLPREVKATVKSLVEDFGLPIGASRSAPFGYFFCVTPADVEDAVRPLVHEIVSLARRVRVLAGSAYAEEIMGQFRLEEKG